MIITTTWLLIILSVENLDEQVATYYALPQLRQLEFIYLGICEGCLVPLNMIILVYKSTQNLFSGIKYKYSVKVKWS